MPYMQKSLIGVLREKAINRVNTALKNREFYPTHKNYNKEMFGNTHKAFILFDVMLYRGFVEEAFGEQYHTKLLTEQIFTILTDASTDPAKKLDWAQDKYVAMGIGANYFQPTMYFQLVLSKCATARHQIQCIIHVLRLR